LARSAFDSNDTGMEPWGRTMDWNWFVVLGDAMGAGLTIAVAACRLEPALALVSKDEEEDDGAGAGGGGRSEVGGFDLSLSRVMISEAEGVLVSILLLATV
jgi:hypothetical protein